MENSTVADFEPSADTLHDPVTDDVRDMFQLINYVILCGSISLFGVAANVINIVVFVKQGFKDSINISLTGLALADLACSITMLWTSTCHNLVILRVALPFDSLDIMYATGGWPHECFNRITSLITAFITLERCLCIAMPLKVKNLITSYRTKVINIYIFISMVVLFAPFYFVNKLEWRYSQLRNRSIFSLTYTQEREIVDSITFFIHSVFLPTTLLIAVIISTIILVVKLNKKTKWRKEATSHTLNKEETTTVKEKKVVKMVILISSIFIACYVPPTVNFLVMVFDTDFSYSGRFYNLFIVTWSVAFVLESINSSVNIFVYVNMSSKFKETLYKLLVPRQSMSRLSID